MSEPYWEPFAALGSNIPDPSAQPDGRWLRTLGGGMVWSEENRLGEDAATITNWNDALENGWYMGNSASNGPGTGGWYIGLVTRHDNLWITQEVWKFTNSQYTLAPRFIRRSYDSAGRTWGGWKPVFVGGSCMAVHAAKTLSSSFTTMSWGYLAHDDFGGGSCSAVGISSMYAPVAGRYRITIVIQTFNQTGTGNVDLRVLKYDSGGGGGFFSTGIQTGSLNGGASATSVDHAPSGYYFTPSIKTSATGAAGTADIWMTLELLAADG